MMRHAVIVLLATAATMAGPNARAITPDEAAVIAAHERVARSVVLVLVRTVEVPGEGMGGVAGSGFAVEPGLVVTNYHVVASASSIDVMTSEGESARAEIVGTAPGFDLALLRVPMDARALPPAPIGASADLEVGQRALACSHPLGLQHAMTAGIVSGLNRELPNLELGPSLIQFDAPLNPGQSGGPLVDSEGRVVGVTTAKLHGAESMGFAVPIDVVVRILPDLKEMGHVFRPPVGLRGVGVDPDLARLLGIPTAWGFLVERVDDGSAAADAGIRAGTRHVTLRDHDYVLGGDVILAVEGIPVRGEGDLNLRFLEARPGKTLSLSVAGRDGRRRVTLVVPAMRH